MSPLESYAWRDEVYKPAFDVLDADHDGRIGRDDLKAFYGGAATDEDISAMISAADADSDGFVELHEFERVLDSSSGKSSSSSSARKGTEEIMAEVFRVMDRDGDGRVGFDDLKAYLSLAGILATDEDVRAMIRVGGAEEDGISCDALIKILALDLGRGF